MQCKGLVVAYICQVWGLFLWLYIIEKNYLAVFNSSVIWSQLSISHFALVPRTSQVKVLPVPDNRT